MAVEVAHHTAELNGHGGLFRELMVDEARRCALIQMAVRSPSLSLRPRQVCDLELLLSGGFAPLDGFMGRAEYDSVVSRMRLKDGTLWPIPITLDIHAPDAERLAGAAMVALRDPTGLLLAMLTMGDLWEPDRDREAQLVYQTQDTYHPGVGYLMNRSGQFYLGGSLEGVQSPKYYDFNRWRDTPRTLQSAFVAQGWKRVVAFQTRNPMHRAHKEITDRAARHVGAHLLIHPAVGVTKPGDIDHFTRVRSYQHIKTRYPANTAMLSLLPLAMRMAGPREAVWHAIIRKNHGCTHFIVGRDHAGPGEDRQGHPYYAGDAAHEMAMAAAREIGIGIVPFRNMVYAPGRRTYIPVTDIEPGEETLTVSGTELRKRLADCAEIPDWFSYPEVLKELRTSHPPRYQQGFVVFLTGLSGSGKSTIAHAVRSNLLELTMRPVSLFDGDVVRKHLGKGLGFSAADRSTNVRRIGFVASEVARHRGIAICAAIAPYRADRDVNRSRIAVSGGYVEVFVDAPLEVCEERDVKGLYARARAGIITGFTGIDDVYEAPENADVVCCTETESIEESMEKVLSCLRDLGYLLPAAL